MAVDPRRAIEVLRDSHDHLTAVVAPLDDAKLVANSYCSEWNIGQVLSHLGSGAEIARLNLEAARLGESPPERSDYEAIWARWNARSPREMADDCLVSDEAHVVALEELSDEELVSLSVPAFAGRFLDTTGAVLMRLSEHAVHLWDVEVSISTEATLQQAPTELLIDVLDERAERLGRGAKPASPVALQVSTSSPERSFVLSLDDAVQLSPGGADAEGRLSIAAEGLIRLFYGRLDPAHTPGETAIEGPVSLDELRRTFPGF